MAEDDGALAALVVLAATAMSLEVLEHLRLARCAAAVLLAVAWSAAFPRDLQLRAALGALVYHGGAELLRTRLQQSQSQQRHSGDDEIHRSSDDDDGVNDHGDNHDQRVFRALLFLVRVFVWGATLAAAASINSSSRADDDSVQSFVARWLHAAMRAATAVPALAGYCEALEVLVLLYFEDQETPYHWRRRAPLWALASAVSALDVSGLLALAARRLLVRVSPLGLVAALAVGMWVSIQLPWRRALAIVEGAAARFRDSRKEKKRRSDDWRFTGHERPFRE